MVSKRGLTQLWVALIVFMCLSGGAVKGFEIFNHPLWGNSKKKLWSQAGPTIYYLKIFNEDEGQGCASRSKVPLFGITGQILTRVCRETLEKCRLEGTCLVIQNGQSITYNIRGRLGNRDTFFPVNTKDGNPESCRFGYGIANACLDPFFTVAADPSVYRFGQALFFPLLKGVVLPDGSVHHGLMIVRDSGRALKGAHHFDFFTGFYSNTSQENPFVLLKIQDKNTLLEYRLANLEETAQIHRERNFPYLSTPATHGVK